MTRPNGPWARTATATSKHRNLDRLAQTRRDLSQRVHGHPGLLAVAGRTHDQPLSQRSWGSPTGSIRNKEPDLGLAPAAITWPELLKGLRLCDDAGGQVAPRHARSSFTPLARVSIVSFGFRDGSNRPIDPKLEVDGQLQQLKGSLPDLLVDEGLKFVEASSRSAVLALDPLPRSAYTRTRPYPSRIRPRIAHSIPRSRISPGLPTRTSQASSRASITRA